MLACRHPWSDEEYKIGPFTRISRALSPTFSPQADTPRRTPNPAAPHRYRLRPRITSSPTGDRRLKGGRGGIDPISKTRNPKPEASPSADTDCDDDLDRDMPGPSNSAATYDASATRVRHRCRMNGWYGWQWQTASHKPSIGYVVDDMTVAYSDFDLIPSGARPTSPVSGIKVVPRSPTCMMVRDEGWEPYDPAALKDVVPVEHSDHATPAPTVGTPTNANCNPHHSPILRHKDVYANHTHPGRRTWDKGKADPLVDCAPVEDADFDLIPNGATSSAPVRGGRVVDSVEDSLPHHRLPRAPRPPRLPRPPRGMDPPPPPPADAASLEIISTDSDSDSEAESIEVIERVTSPLPVPVPVPVLVREPAPAPSRWWFTSLWTAPTPTPAAPPHTHTQPLPHDEWGEWEYVPRRSYAAVLMGPEAMSV